MGDERKDEEFLSFESERGKASSFPPAASNRWQRSLKETSKASDKDA